MRKLICFVARVSPLGIEVTFLSWRSPAVDREIVHQEVLELISQVNDEENLEEEPILCVACNKEDDSHLLITCTRCDEATHTYCIKPPRVEVPKGTWICYRCWGGVIEVKKRKERTRTTKGTFAPER